MSPINTKFQPYHDNLLVKVIESPTQTPAGLIIPETSRDKSSKGEVIACGPGKFSDKGDLIFLQTKPGHIVLFAPYAGTQISVNGEEFLLIKESDVIGRFLESPLN